MYKFLSLLSAVIILFTFTSCRNNDEDESQDTTSGKLQIKFENGFNNLGDIVLNQTTQTSSQGQKHNFSALKYIISNISLVDEAGNEFKYNENNPDKGAFIIDQADAVAGIVYINLDEVPKRNYKKVKFGLGLSQNAYLLGQDGQAEFWTKAKQKGMTWSWAAGYVFVKLEGKYGTASPQTEFMNHTGNMGNVTANNTPDLYREITLDLPTTARVSTQITPSIHILADLNQFLSGENTLSLNSTNDMMMGSSQHLVNVTNNLTKMFKVDHVHND
ncbi:MULTISPECIES: MbnP family protein [unclassified Chryseobacterium]|uniref:MbnP family protein n=1 Tax=unclassified Chryseobacterium TaxID=2593645 RepID=UPI00226AD91A|nr:MULTISPECIES: MbnP family protein [unclassified Chryseobacterium]